MGWWSTAPPSGPTPAQLPIQRQILEDYNESAVFLAFHPSRIQQSSSGAGKLPLTVYESVYEGDHVDGEKKMQVDNEEQSLNIRFRELPYSVETGEAEMIGIDTITRSGRNAAALDAQSVPSSQRPIPCAEEAKANGKAKEKSEDGPVILSPEEEERESSTTANLSDESTNPSFLSDRQPQHPTQRDPHPGIPNLTNKILSLERPLVTRRRR